MNLLMITFALRNEEKDYSPFFVAVKGNAMNWWHFIPQTIVVSTQLDTRSFAEQLYPLIESTDSFLIAKMTPHEFEGWLPNVAWEWLNGVSVKIEADKEGVRRFGMSPPPKLTP